MKATAKPIFIADAMLGRLARALRMLGYDVVYRSDIEDSTLKLEALRGSRVLLTRDHEVAETCLPVQVVLVSDDHVEGQLRQVVRELGLKREGDTFTRCVVCNRSLVEVEREAVRERVPPYVFRTQTRFARCPGCGRIYWEATHVARAREWLDTALGDEAADDEDGR